MTLTTLKSLEKTNYSMYCFATRKIYVLLRVCVLPSMCMCIYTVYKLSIRLLRVFCSVSDFVTFQFMLLVSGDSSRNRRRRSRMYLVALLRSFVCRGSCAPIAPMCSMNRNTELLMSNVFVVISRQSIDV